MLQRNQQCVRVPCPCSDCQAVQQAIVEDHRSSRDFKEVAQRLGVGGAA